jgi:hypothetical protein
MSSPQSFRTMRHTQSVPELQEALSEKRDTLEGLEAKQEVAIQKYIAYKARQLQAKTAMLKATLGLDVKNEKKTTGPKVRRPRRPQSGSATPNGPPARHGLRGRQPSS